MTGDELLAYMKKYDAENPGLNWDELRTMDPKEAWKLIREDGKKQTEYIRFCVSESTKMLADDYQDNPAELAKIREYAAGFVTRNESDPETEAVYQKALDYVDAKLNNLPGCSL